VVALGETKARLAEAYERLCSPPLDDLDFVLADVRLDLTRRFTEYSGDISGRMLGALQLAGPILGRTSPMVEPLAAAFPAAQQPDGHFGCDQDLHQLDQRRDMPILWGNGRLLLAMAERLREKKDPELLAAAKKLGDYVISTRKVYGKRENFEKVGGHFASGFTTCYPSLVDGMAALGEVTGDQRFSDEARFIAHLSLIDDSFEKRHSHGRLSAFRGMLDLDRNLDRPEFVPLVAAKVRMITDKLMLPIGGITEQFDRDDGRDEGCSVADWIRINFFLWEETGDLRFLDNAEHALRNHLAANQQRNGGFGHRFWGALKHGGNEYPGARLRGFGTEAYWCCSMHGTQVLADAARWSILAAGGDIIVTWLGEAKSELKINDRTVTVTATRLSPSAWTLSFDAADGDHVRLRVPGWAGSIKIDGHEREVKNGWATLVADGATSWKVEFPGDIQLRGPYGDAVVPGQPVRVFAAGELYCLPESEIIDGLIGPDDVPQLVMAPKQPDRSKLQVVIVTDGQRTQRATLVPVARRPWGGNRLLFDVRRIGPREFRQLQESAQPASDPGTPLELNVGCDGLAEVYLNGREVTHTRSWVENPSFEAFSNKEANILALKVLGDKPQPGVIATLRAGGHPHVTGKGKWSAVPCGAEPDKQWLTDPGKGVEKAVEISDLGGFGVAPWKQMPAGYAGSGARWIWPKPSVPKQWWLLRYEFRIPQESNAPESSTASSP
jgi:hypothetical protein